ncbi:N-methyl-L-tryptophan oxidase [Streptomyces shenzhenensis]|uniref:N-methyl-L-tryptophan oxidase n=1 Tax=Streptomyces shenzhenensis TaxID=943815 RepID=UPI0015F0E7B2|nr:N-methyl-L-tryptophan oxidase [Streptomyces shenzhenensis]
MTHQRHYDTIVVGLGAWGSATLSHLAGRGLSVLGIDQFTPPHVHGSHHGNGRAIRMASPEGAFYTPMMRRAYELWHELEAETGAEVLTTVGGVYAAPPDDEMIWGALRSYEGTDIPHELLSVAEARARFPWLRVKDGESVIHEPGTGRLHPERSIVAHTDLARRYGAEVVFGQGMKDWEQKGGGVVVTTTGGGTLTADRLVLTLGSWAPHHLRLDIPLVAERQVIAVYDVSDVPGPLTMVSLPSTHTEAFYGVPEQGDTFKLALHHGGLTGPTDELPTTVTDEEKAILRSYVDDRLPLFPAEPLQVTTCKYTNTPDRHFVLARHPDAPSVVVGAGCSGRGFKFATFIGEALADLATGVERPDLHHFSPDRFTQART